MTTVSKRRPSLRERLLSKAVINMETGCWEWTASKDGDGYGRIRVVGAMASAHRTAYELIEGPILCGLTLDHTCRVRACINPAHLEPVTQGENTLRSPSNPIALNATRTHCPQGHEYTAENTRMFNGSRKCRACGRAATTTYKQRISSAQSDTSGGAL